MLKYIFRSKTLWEEMLVPIVWQELGNHDNILTSTSLLILILLGLALSIFIQTPPGLQSQWFGSLARAQCTFLKHLKIIEQHETENGKQLFY